MKKAQMEIIGLAFIVIIIIFGLVFYLALNSGDKKVPTRKIIEYKELGEATETAMLDTIIPKCGYELRTAIQNCISAPYLACSNQKICEVVNENMKLMLEGTFGSGNELHENYRSFLRNKDGELLTYNGEKILIEPDRTNCNETSNTYAGPSQPISTSQGPVYFVIEFCS